MDLAENASFSGFGVICLQPLPSILPGEFSEDVMNTQVWVIFNIQSIAPATAAIILLLINYKLQSFLTYNLRTYYIVLRKVR